MNSKEQFTTDVLGSIRAALHEFEADQLEFHHPAVTAQSLASLWQLGDAAPRRLEPSTYVREAPPESLRYKTRPALPAEPEWDLGLSTEFRKAIRSIDRKLQGRVLQAIDHISAKPTVAQGDTVTPLGGDLKGLWRYRIGDYRLLYRPDSQNQRVVLVTFVSRGGAYE